MNEQDHHYELSKWLEAGQEQSDPNISDHNLEAIRMAVDLADDLVLPPLDLEEHWNELKQMRSDTKKGIRPLLVLAVAASIAILLGVFLMGGDDMVNYPISHLNVVTTLPDGQSLAIVSDHAKIRYDVNDNRTLEMEGTAYYHVVKGQPFSVKTKLGTVQVLGTSFEVASSSDLLVRCFSGKVAVEVSSGVIQQLEPGQGLRVSESGAVSRLDFSDSHPSWVLDLYEDDQITFEDQIKMMEVNYQIIIERPSNFNPSIQGALPHNDLPLAIEILQEILPIEIRKSVSNKYVIVER